MTRLVRVGALLIGFLSLQGCILGRVRDEVPIDPAKVGEIKIGQTTKREVVELLGAPTYMNDRLGLKVSAGPPRNGSNNVGPLVDEMVRSPLDHSYIYEYTDTKSASLYLLVVSFTNQETKRDRVVIFFDEKGVVTHMGASFNAKDVAFKLPISD